MNRDALLEELQKHHPDSPEAKALMAQITSAPRTEGAPITAPLPTQQFSTRGSAGGIDFDQLLRDFPAPQQQAAPLQRTSPPQAAPQASGLKVYRVQAPDGSVIKVEGPDGASEAEVLAQAQALYQPQPAPAAPAKPAPATQPRRWSDVPVEAIGNVPASAGRFAKGIYDAVTDLPGTATAIGDLAYGGFRHAANAVSPRIAQTLEPTGPSEGATRAEQVASQAWAALRQRYGSEEGWKKTLATDPVGALADLSTVATGGSMLAPKAATIAKLGAAAPIVSGLVKGAEFVGKYADPVQLAASTVSGLGKGATALGRATLGTATGAGSDAIRVAFETGKQGGPGATAFRQNMRGLVDEGEILDDARRGMKKISEDRSRAFDKEIATSTNQSPMDMKPIMANVEKLAKTATYKEKPIVGADEWAVIQKARDKVAEWAKDPSLHSPEGINALRKSIDAIYPGPEQRQARRILSGITGDLNLRVASAEPAFGRANAAFAESRDLSNQLEKTMSLSGRAADDTTLRKLLSAGRDNINTSYGYRSRLLDQLESLGGVQLRPAIAGSALHNLAPRGLQAGVAGGVGSVGFMSGNLAAIPILAAQSPRLVGEVTHAAGRLAGLPGRAAASVAVRTPQGMLDLLATARKSAKLRNLPGNTLSTLSELEQARLDAEKRRRESK